MAFLTTKSSIYVTLLVTIGCISPFVHIFYGISDEEGLFGYRYMSSFLNAVGRVNALLCAALFIKFAASKITTEYKSLVNFGANMFLFVASFFMLAVFIPKKQLFGTADFPPYYYWLSMIGLSFASAQFFNGIQRVIIITEDKLKKHIRKLNSYLWSKVKSKELNEIEVFDTIILDDE